MLFINLLFLICRLIFSLSETEVREPGGKRIRLGQVTFFVVLGTLLRIAMQKYD